ncbi:MAG: transglycosylase SLT domain-containing protein [Armatimonadota bacterium]|nr:transglycosylase SLT domain-containing protein [Armatimonadota bacterium]
MRRAVWGVLAVAVSCVVLSTPARAASVLHEGARAFAQGRLGEAETLLQRAVSSRPADAHAWLWLGVVQFHQGDPVGAEQAVGHAARLAPRNPSVLLWWGHVLARAGKTDRAIAAFQRALLAGSARQQAMAAQAIRALRPVPGLPPARDGDERTPARPVAPLWVHDAGSYRAIAQYYNRRLSDADAARIADALLGYSRMFNLDPRLVVALVVVESGFQPRALSRAGAMGLGQLMPGTARALRVNPWDPVQNLYGTIRYLRGNLDRFGWENAHLALAAYNAGRGAVERYEGIPPYAETQWYVANVSSLYRRLLSLESKMPELRRRLPEN